MNTATPDPSERARASVRRWYARNREEYAALRKKRYRSDPKRREKARKAAARYRKARAKGLTVQRTLWREMQGQLVQVYTTGYIADRVGISPATLRGWHNSGLLPEPLFPDSKHRLYTARQVELVRLLADTQKMHNRVGVNRATRMRVLNEVVGVIHKTWKVSEHGRENGKKARRRTR